jgi:fructokinase
MSAGRDGVVLVAGEALVDLVPAGDVLRPHPGGGPFNVARTVARLGRPVVFLGRLSTDAFGAEHARLLAEDGVALDAAVRTAAPSTLALAEVGEDGSARYRFYLEGTAAPGLTRDEALAALPSSVAILHVGTLGLAVEPIASALEAVAERLAGRALVVVDPNCRPSAVRDPDAYRRRLWRVLPRAHVVKASEEDLAWLEPARSAPATARALLDAGARVVLVTHGERGATVLTAAGDATIPAPRVRVADTIGAGDAFGGAFTAWWHASALGVAGLARHDAVLAAARFAALVAARTCERAGAVPPRLDELGAAALP